MNPSIPVITIDGPSGTGKGTIAGLLAHKLGFHLLDSGALYRALAWVVIEKQVDPESDSQLTALLEDLVLDIEMLELGEPLKISCLGQEITEVIRQESVSNMASKISANPMIRKYLLAYQQMMRQAPGLVADGRDMGSVIFPDATLKIYLDASTEIRAQRRYNQLKEKGISVSLRDIQVDLQSRDYRDEHRSIAPLKQMPDMVRVDSSNLTIEEVLEQVMAELQSRLQK